jgi:hypothetical protein
MAFIGNTNTTQAFTPAIDYFSGTGSATAFTLSRPVASVAQVQVTIDNVAQNPSSAYTVSSNTITFTSAPLSGTNNIYVYYTSPITQVIAPSQGTVTTTSLTSGLALTSPTITGGALNGTLGATTPSTVAATSITASTTLGVTGAATLTADATISGLTVGKGGSAVSTNTALGVSALASVSSASYIYNTAVGYQALTALNGGSQNTAFGYQTMVTTNTGGANASFGDLSLKSNTSGSYNTAVGSTALYSNTTATRNVAVGAQALYTNSTGEYNTALGMNAMQNSTTTSNNTCVGYSAGNGITTGTTNTCFGVTAGNNLTTGAYGLYVGFGSQASGSGAVAEMVICTTGTTVVGKGNTTGFINPNGGGLYQGNNSSSWSTTSDRRLKKNIVDNTEGLDKITAIRIRNFEYKLPEEVTELDQSCAVTKEGVQLGVIAQELQEVCSDCVKTESTGVMAVDSDNIFWHMINAIKDLKAINDTQAATITALTARIEALENR